MESYKPEELVRFTHLRPEWDDSIDKWDCDVQYIAAMVDITDCHDGYEQDAVSVEVWCEELDANVTVEWRRRTAAEEHGGRWLAVFSPGGLTW